MIRLIKAWWYDVSNIVQSFEKIQSKLMAAANYHAKVAGNHLQAVDYHTQQRAISEFEAKRALAISDKIAALIK